MKIKAGLFLVLLFFSLHYSTAQVAYNFSAQSGVYTPLINATNAPLTSVYVSGRTLLDESASNNIPIGFSFQFNGLDYAVIHLNANGFASLREPFLVNAAIDNLYDNNELSNISSHRGVTRPLLAPFWDDLSFTNATDLSYKTEGVAPNRIFTAQWQNMSWKSGTAALSFQLKIYETTDIVEFVYRSESGSGSAGKSASIGLTSESSKPTLNDSGYFISLTSTGSSPAISRTEETSNLSVKPASGQIYRFTPFTCSKPNGLKIVEYDQNSATITWNPLKGTTAYEYALNDVEVEPATGLITTANSVNLTSLAPNTAYFFYNRSVCGSAWQKISFKTPNSVTLPYSEGFEGSLDNSLPQNMRQENRSNSFADVYWQTTGLMTAASGGSKAAVNTSPFVDAQTWLYTPQMNLEADKSYKIRFKYATSGGTQALEVRYGLKVGANSMDNVLFDKTNLNNTAYKDTSITFTPPASGNYYFGFLYKSAVNNQVFLLDDLAVSRILFDCADNPVLSNYASGTSKHVKAANFINAANKINAGANVLYQSGKSVVLNPGFEAKNGAVFKAQIGGCN